MTTKKHQTDIEKKLQRIQNDLHELTADIHGYSKEYEEDTNIPLTIRKESLKDQIKVLKHQTVRYLKEQESNRRGYAELDDYLRQRLEEINRNIDYNQSHHEKDISYIKKTFNWQSVSIVSLAIGGLYLLFLIKSLL